MSLPHLFAPLTIRAVSFRNRIGVSPMCQYSAVEGFVNDWHLVHLGSRAAGGAGLVLTEAASVDPRGRISPADLGIWDDQHVPGLQRVAAFIRAQGATAGIQLAHAGRKASTAPPWEGGAAVPPDHGGWQPVAPTAEPFDSGSPVPHALDRDGILDVVAAFRRAAARARAAGFQVVEIHAAHGYLIHEFLSPLTNRRTDEFGGDHERRSRIHMEVLAAVRRRAGADFPVFVRLGMHDERPGGLTLAPACVMAAQLVSAGASLIDVSGGLAGSDDPGRGPGYFVGYAEALKAVVDVPVLVAGGIADPRMADLIIRSRRADIVGVGRAMLDDPGWTRGAAAALGQA